MAVKETPTSLTCQQKHIKLMISIACESQTTDAVVVSQRLSVMIWIDQDSQHKTNQSPSQRICFGCVFGEAWLCFSVMEGEHEGVGWAPPGFRESTI
jgi:hypothetical protein